MDWLQGINNVVEYIEEKLKYIPPLWTKIGVGNDSPFTDNLQSKTSGLGSNRSSTIFPLILIPST